MERTPEHPSLPAVASVITNTDITQPINAQAHTAQINTNVPPTTANHNNHYYETAPNVQPNLNNQPHIDSFRNIHTQNSASSLQTTADNHHFNKSLQ